jgi:SOS-response transcriptional repressor LexA
MAKGLTDKQRTILSLVEGYWREHGSAPSVAEIATEVGVSKPTAHAHLLALKKKGFLVHTEGRGRSWRGRGGGWKPSWPGPR